MLIDLLSTDNYISFNIKVAEMLGLHTAIYLAEIMNINSKAIRKDKIYDEYFILDREYIKSRTTLSIKEQDNIDNTLFNLNILIKSPDDDCKLKLDIDMLASIISDEKYIKKDVKTILGKTADKKTKSEKIVDNLKKSVIIDNEQLKQAYSTWIDNVYSKLGWMSSQAVIEAQEVVNKASNRELQVALDIIAIATTNGYKDMNWAVNKYNTLHQKNNPIGKLIPVSDRIQLSQSTIDYLNNTYDKATIDFVFNKINIYCNNKQIIYTDNATLNWFNTEESNNKIHKKQSKPQLVSIL